MKSLGQILVLVILVQLSEQQHAGIKVHNCSLSVEISKQYTCAKKEDVEVIVEQSNHEIFTTLLRAQGQISEYGTVLTELQSKMRKMEEMMTSQRHENHELTHIIKKLTHNQTKMQEDSAIYQINANRGNSSCPNKGNIPSYPVVACKDIPQDSPSGEYWIRDNTNSPILVYCDMTRTCCNTTGGWTRVANIDMTDPSQQCPDGFRLKNSTSPKLRLCGRTGPITGCVSTTFPVHGIQYSHVCGRIKGYQYGAPFAFYYGSKVKVIDQAYVDGFSLTYGDSPRQHIWTFAAGSDDVSVNNNWVCPCSGGVGITIPHFVGGDYFCETANHVSTYKYSTPFYRYPLWDGEHCGALSNAKCCTFNNPPWFCKQLPQPTTDDIELRQCNVRYKDSDTPFEIVEIYIK